VRANNLEKAIIKDELKLIDIGLLIPNLVLFGEYIEIFENTLVLFIKNKIYHNSNFISELTNHVLNKPL